MVDTVYGVLTPPLLEGNGTNLRNWFFEKDELPLLLEAFVGKPVRLEHDPNLVVGKVLMLELDSLGNLGAYLAVDTTTLLGRLTMHRIKTGETLGLSINYDAVRVEGCPHRVGSFVPIDISIVKRPVMEGSRILRYGNRNVQYVSASGIHKIMDPAPTAPQMIPVPQGLSVEAMNEALNVALAIRSGDINLASLKGFELARKRIADMQYMRLAENRDMVKLIREEKLASNPHLETAFDESIEAHTHMSNPNFATVMNIACGYRSQISEQAATIHTLQKQVDEWKTAQQAPRSVVIERPDIPVAPPADASYDASIAKRARLMTDDALERMKEAVRSTRPSRDELEAECDAFAKASLPTFKTADMRAAPP